MKSTKLIACSIILLLFTVSFVKAQHDTLKISSAWETDANWSEGYRPTSSDTAVIPDGITATISSAAICNSLIIGDGSGIASSV